MCLTHCFGSSSLYAMATEKFPFQVCVTVTNVLTRDFIALLLLQLLPRGPTNN